MKLRNRRVDVIWIEIVSELVMASGKWDEYFKDWDGSYRMKRYQNDDENSY